MKKLFVIMFVMMVLATPLFAQGAAESSEVVIGTAIYKYDDTFMTGVRNAIVAASEGTNGVVKSVDSMNSQAVQNEKVDQFLTQGVQSLAINAVDRAAAGTIIEKAKKDNVPIVFFNREPFAEDMAKWNKVYYVGAKAEESGLMSGQIIADYWKANKSADRNGDGVLQYVMLKGEPGHQDAELRTLHSIKEIEASGIKVEKLAEDTAMWDRVKGQEKMAAFIAAHGDKIEAVLANNDDMALGAIEALKAANYFKEGRYIPVVGVDATAPALAAIENGTLLGTVLNDAVNQGSATFRIAYELGSNRTPNEKTVGYPIQDNQYVWVPYQKVTKENYKNFL